MLLQTKSPTHDVRLSGAQTPYNPFFSRLHNARFD